MILNSLSNRSANVVTMAIHFTIRGAAKPATSVRLRRQGWRWNDRRSRWLRLGDQRKVVRAERRHRQAFVGEEVADRVVGPGIAHGDRASPRRSTPRFRCPDDFALCRCQTLSSPQTAKPRASATSNGRRLLPKQSSVTIALLPVDCHALELGAAIRELHAVVLHQRPADEARGDVVLVLRMDVLAFAEVDDDRLAGVRQLHASWSATSRSSAQSLSPGSASPAMKSASCTQ